MSREAAKPRRRGTATYEKGAKSAKALVTSVTPAAGPRHFGYPSQARRPPSARRPDVRPSDLRRGAERVMRESAERRSHDLPWRANREAVARRTSGRLSGATAERPSQAAFPGRTNLGGGFMRLLVGLMLLGGLYGCSGGGWIPNG